jgi:hypothetical protein
MSMTPYTASGYEKRALECVTLANQAIDPLVQSELLKLRQTYLKIARLLREQMPPERTETSS